MIDLAERIVNFSLKLGAEYAEARIGRVVKTTIRAVNDKLEKITSGIDRGVGIRTLHKGAFGFASLNSFNRKDLEESSKMAVKAAKASSTEIKEKVVLAPVKAFEDRVVMHVEEDTSKVDVTRKMDLIIRAYKAAKEVSSKVASVDTLYEDGTEEGAIVTSEGTKIFRGSSYLVLRVLVFAKEEDKIRMCHESMGFAGGFEVFKKHSVETCAEKAAERAVAMLKAKPAPSGRFTIIADPLLAGTFAHEATGHACEGDAVISGESILKDKLGQMIGSQCVSMYDDSSLPQSWGSLKYDDEGVRTKKRLLIDRGIL
ncbi:MAG: TldD/PmbA family protein, partial [Candidatus Bathyarchaeota archaeon]|nr:TldD/PmbA family protein [Candidatus Bathyarchaeota archaeon]